MTQEPGEGQNPGSILFPNEFSTAEDAARLGSLRHVALALLEEDKTATKNRTMTIESGKKVPIQIASYQTPLQESTGGMNSTISIISYKGQDLLTIGSTFQRPNSPYQVRVMTNIGDLNAGAKLLGYDKLHAQTIEIIDAETGRPIYSNENKSKPELLIKYGISLENINEVLGLDYDAFAYNMMFMTREVAIQERVEIEDVTTLAAQVKREPVEEQGQLIQFSRIDKESEYGVNAALNILRLEVDNLFASRTEDSLEYSMIIDSPFPHSTAPCELSFTLLQDPDTESSFLTASIDPEGADYFIEVAIDFTEGVDHPVIAFVNDAATGEVIHILRGKKMEGPDSHENPLLKEQPAVSLSEEELQQISDLDLLTLVYGTLLEVRDDVSGDISLGSVVTPEGTKTLLYRDVHEFQEDLPMATHAAIEMPTEPIGLEGYLELSDEGKKLAHITRIAEELLRDQQNTEDITYVDEDGKRHSTKSCYMHGGEVKVGDTTYRLSVEAYLIPDLNRTNIILISEDQSTGIQIQTYIERTGAGPLLPEYEGNDHIIVSESYIVDGETDVQFYNLQTQELIAPIPSRLEDAIQKYLGGETPLPDLLPDFFNLLSDNTSRTQATNEEAPASSPLEKYVQELDMSAFDEEIAKSERELSEAEEDRDTMLALRGKAARQKAAVTSLAGSLVNTAGDEGKPRSERAGRKMRAQTLEVISQYYGPNAISDTKLHEEFKLLTGTDKATSQSVIRETIAASQINLRQYMLAMKIDDLLQGSDLAVSPNLSKRQLNFRLVQLTKEAGKLGEIETQLRGAEQSARARHQEMMAEGEAQCEAILKEQMIKRLVARLVELGNTEEQALEHIESIQFAPPTTNGNDLASIWHDIGTTRRELGKTGTAGQSAQLLNSGNEIDL